jgi:coproporphyrinogen III oxidase-like Fe-S oxidoreductase
LILTGLRTQWGVDFVKLSALVELSNLWHQKIVAFERDGVLEWVGDNFRLTKKAKLQADFYAAELFM